MPPYPFYEDEDKDDVAHEVAQFSPNEADNEKGIGVGNKVDEPKRENEGGNENGTEADDKRVYEEVQDDPDELKQEKEDDDGNVKTFVLRLLIQMLILRSRPNIMLKLLVIKMMQNRSTMTLRMLQMVVMMTKIQMMIQVNSSMKMRMIMGIVIFIFMKLLKGWKKSTIVFRSVDIQTDLQAA